MTFSTKCSVKQSSRREQETMFSKLRHYGIALASILAVIGALLMFFAPLFFNLTRSLVLSMTTKSTFDLWRRNPIPLYLEFYLFNWTNPEELEMPGSKPHFEEIGPFVFEETKEKVNISFNDNNTITFRHQKYWYFREDMSVSGLDTPITTINALVVFASYMLRDWSYMIRAGFSLAVKTTSSQIFKSTSVGEVLFAGYQDHLLTLAQSMPQLKGIKLPPFDKFGWFYTRNGSYTFEGTFNMDMSGANFGGIREFNYEPNMSLYDDNGPCNDLRGSAGEFYGPDLKRDRIGFFSQDMMRYVPLDYERDVYVDGTKGYKYVVGESFLDNGTKVVENMCYCGDYCTPNGVLNISAARYGAPAYVSMPHFYGADPYYLDKIEGLKPDSEKHEMFMVVEPLTGIPLHVEAKLQLNVLVSPIKGISVVENVPTFIFPVIWFQQKATMPPHLNCLLKLLLYLELICRCVGGVMLIVGLPWLFFLLRPSFTQKTCWKSSKSNYAMSTIPRHLETSESGKPLMETKEAAKIRPPL